MAAASHPFLDALHRYSRIGLPRRMRPTVQADAVPPAIDTPDAPDVPASVLRHLPSVGLLVALIQTWVYALTSLLLPHGVAVVLTVIAGVLLTGAVHERGWMRWCEMQGAAHAAEDALAPVKGSQGSAAALAGVLLVVLRVEALAHLDPGWFSAVLVCAAGISRGLAVAVSAMAPRGGTVAMAMAIALMPAVALAAWTGDAWSVIAGTGCAVLASAVVRALSRRRLRDEATLGAVQQVAEVACLVGMLAVLQAVDVDLDTEQNES